VLKRPWNSTASPSLLSPITAAILLALAIPFAASADDETCQRVRSFHQAIFDDSEAPVGRRWVEMRWHGHWLDFEKGFGLECRASPDIASTALCAWLRENTSFEFAGMLPRRILTCFGYVFPREHQQVNWRSDVTVLSEDRWLVLEIDFFTMRNDTGAIRLSSFAAGQDETTVEMDSLVDSDSPVFSK